MKMKNKPILCLDFDGVLHSYASGWKGPDVIPDPPVAGAIEALYNYLLHFDVCVYGARSATVAGIRAMQDWLLKWDEEFRQTHPEYRSRDPLVMNIRFPYDKPSAWVTLDDRAITFTGKFPTAESLLAFKPWHTTG